MCWGLAVVSQQEGVAHCIALMQSQQSGRFRVCAGTWGAMLQPAEGYCCDSLLGGHGCPVHQGGRNTLSPCSSQLFWSCPSCQSPLWEPAQCCSARACNTMSTEVSGGDSSSLWQLRDAAEMFRRVHTQDHWKSLQKEEVLMPPKHQGKQDGWKCRAAQGCGCAELPLPRLNNPSTQAVFPTPAFHTMLGPLASVSHHCSEPHSPRARLGVPEASEGSTAFALPTASPTLCCTNQPSSFLRRIPAILLPGSWLPGVAFIPVIELIYPTLFLLLPLIILAYLLHMPGIKLQR